MSMFPKKNVGIELNGIYWHSESMGKDKKYHLNKTIACDDNGVQLLHIWDTEWLHKQDIIKSMILNKIGKTPIKIFARKCEIREVLPKEKNIFLNENHLQGEDKSKIKLGLYYSNELVSLLTVGKPRFNKKYEWEIIRYCNKINTSVVGGFSKLLSSFRKKHDGSIITYANRRYSNGGLYKNNGFTFIRYSKPGYQYYKPGKNLETRNSYQKHKLSSKLNIFDSMLSEWENMQLNGYDRVWDCGNYVYSLD